MNVYEITPGYRRLLRPTGLSVRAAWRLKWFEHCWCCYYYYDGHGENTRLACRHFDVSLETFCRR